MQPMLLWMFERQVLLQCEFVLQAAEDIDKGLKKRDVAAITVVFRDYDPKTGELSFWGQEFKVHEIVSEVKRILPKLKEDVSKPEPK